MTLRMRASQLDAFAHGFLADHPEAVVLHLGCGLDSRCRRVDWRGLAVDWYDLDLSDVIDLRNSFFPEMGHYHLIASSVTDLEWIAQVDARGRPAFVVAEGLLMYLTEAQVRALFLRLRAEFPGNELACESFSRLTATGRAHPSLHKTGAVIQWGIDEPRAIGSWAPGIKLQEEWL